VQVCFTVDVEPDCPPYLSSWRGIDEGMPLLLDLLADERVPATLFTTGEVARRYPEVVARAVADDHELGCHGDQHRSLTAIGFNDALGEIRRSTEVLRAFAPVRAFRAPYLQLPDACLPILSEQGYRVDSSVARYKSLRPAPAARVSGLVRVAVSISSSWLRLPAPIRRVLLASLRNPIVLFVHPWEFVDWRASQLRWDCRVRTGAPALACVRDTLRFLRARGAVFLTMAQLVGGSAAEES
jgi:peptidoglycan/xylan/chitin deacetylase (PgdA/CDA1 family)